MIKVVRDCSFVSGVWSILILAVLLLFVVIVGIGNAAMLPKVAELLKYGATTDAVLLAGGSVQFLLPSS